MVKKRRRKFKTVKAEGTTVVVRIQKDSDRPPFPPPVITHKSDKEYDRKQVRKETRELTRAYKEGGH